MSSPRKPFEPKGTLPEWRLIYDNLLAEADFGTLITYDQLDTVLGRPFRDNRSPLKRAVENLGAMRKRWLACVPQVGYRVIEANEHVVVAQAHKRRARRQLGTMVKVGEVTDIDRLAPDDLKRWENQSRLNAIMYSVLAQHESRIRRIEEVLHGQGRLPPP